MSMALGFRWLSDLARKGVNRDVMPRDSNLTALVEPVLAAHRAVVNSEKDFDARSREAQLLHQVIFLMEVERNMLLSKVRALTKQSARRVRTRKVSA